MILEKPEELKESLEKKEYRPFKIKVVNGCSLRLYHQSNTEHKKNQKII
jgi:hypothetical protein